MSLSRIEHKANFIHSIPSEMFKQMTTSKAKHLRHRDKEYSRYLMKRHNLISSADEALLTKMK